MFLIRIFKNDTLQKLRPSKCAKGFSDIFHHLGAPVKLEWSKEKVTGADFQFLILNFIMKSFEIRSLTDFRPPQNF